MSKLNVDQKTIIDLLSDKKADFLIPDYQRPYAWNEEQCQTLWDDIFYFLSLTMTTKRLMTMKSIFLALLLLTKTKMVSRKSLMASNG
ncbi:DUF262 domain-containing protein [Synechocystis sp. B12]|nr:DUF262 domain-containing protein [Synechocystis sp. B12]